jgi:hypothetical protein
LNPLDKRKLDENNLKGKEKVIQSQSTHEEKEKQRRGAKHPRRWEYMSDL